ncbi:MAG: beta-glucuronidase [Anaerolineae bacterium]|nr:beta-glucuronidase [Anaerolineae bacterium]
MLYPQSNRYRQVFDLSGFWDIRFDLDDEGDSAGWASGFTQGQPIAVPASWNDQLDSMRDYTGSAWYQIRFDVPWELGSRKYMLRFGSVNYLADVWLNGAHLGSHEGGHLPFEFDVTQHLHAESNRLVVRVDGALAPDRVPPGNVSMNALDRFGELNYPDGSFDFFPYCGIHRPVLLYAAAAGGLSDLTVVTDINGDTGLVSVQLRRDDAAPVRARLTLRGHGEPLSTEMEIAEQAEVGLEVPQAALWAPGSPNLYDLIVELEDGGQIVDRYTLPIGIRTIHIEGDSLLLNGRPIYLKGFGRHEDFPVIGRGLFPAVIVKDYALMEWIGANSFRTSHYPYSEQMMDLADRLGFLVIDETPAVGLFFAEDGLERRLDLCRQYTRELIARDKNHPSVIAWSLANEPHSRRPAAKAFFRDLYDLAGSLDPTRPVTIVSMVGVEEDAFEFVDFLCLNRYYGWYSEPGRLDVGCEELSDELDMLYERYHKPLVLSEFGADTVAGCHAEPPEMFSEEYQAEMLARYIEVLRSKPFVIGEHVWNMCDFKTGQMVRRVGGYNLKGVFTRDRRPKMAAHCLRQIWRQGAGDGG